MLGDITIGQMYPSNSVIHKLDPRFKLIFTTIFVGATLLVALCVGWRVWRSAKARPAEEICKG